MRTRTKVITSIIALVLSAVMLFVAVAVNNNTGKTVVADTPTRTVVLAESSIDAQSILDEFDDATLTTEGTTTYFEGFKPLDLNAVSELDYISDIDYETLSECTVKYNFSYDYESNIVTIAAAATLPDGSIEIDEISGVGFINDENEIDAVMNIDGEGVLLSEMRDAGMIENCGWFSNLIKAVAKAVVVVAVAAVAVAAVVVTAGAAAPAVVGAGVAVASTVVGTAATIAGYATITAAIAAGVYVAADQIDKITYNGINYDAEELTDKKIKKLPTTAYYLALAASDGKMVFCATPISKSLAVAVMRANTVVSIYTYKSTSARGIAQEASNFMSPIWEYRHQSGYFNHYHLGNLTIKGDTHSVCKSHAFYGLPVV